MARTLVIGGTSMIGRPLVEALLSRGDDVTILHRSPGTPFGDRVTELRADRNDPDAVKGALEGRSFDLVFDNVYDWQRGTTAEQVIATVQAVADGLERYVFTSSVGAYPDGGVFAEDAEMVTATDPNPYRVQKAESERALFRFSEETGLQVSTLRPAFVYGPWNNFEREAFFWDRLVAGRPIILPEDGSTTMQWVSAADVARAAVLAATKEAGANQAFNLAGEPLSQVEYVRLLARVAGVDAELVPVPRQKLQAAGGDLFGPPLYFGVFLDIPPVTVSGEKVRDLLGLDLTPLEAGLRATFEWYRSQNRPAPAVEWEDRMLENVVWGS
jgi:2'-hydroxyisoflavone reductase